MAQAAQQVTSGYRSRWEKMVTVMPLGPLAQIPEKLPPSRVQESWPSGRGSEQVAGSARRTVSQFRVLKRCGRPTQARTAEPFLADPQPAPPATAPPPAEPSEPPPATFEDAWPKSERARAADSLPPRRSGRAPTTSTEPSAGPAAADRYPPAARNEEQPQVTVLKSGVVDGMAYSLYSDGSIEAQMPEGMMRFASIDELRAHLDQRS